MAPVNNSQRRLLYLKKLSDVWQIVSMGRLWRGLILCSVLLIAAKADANPVNRLQQLIGNRDAVRVTAPGGEAIFSKNDSTPLIPASTLKLFTSLVALHYLGPDYRFSTEFYLGDDSRLIIKGYGDPLFISDQIDRAAAQIARQQLTVSHITVDPSYFSTPIVIPGVSDASSQPYDSPNGALCANFNTVCFDTSNGQYISGEPETPLLPCVIEQIRLTHLSRGRITLSHDGHAAALYTGRLFQHFLGRHGIPTTADILTTGVDKCSDRLVYTRTSEFNLSEVISRLLEFSNNFTANQIFIAAGAAAFHPPGDLNKAVKAAAVYARNELEIKNFSLVEGSGISRENRISAECMDRILEAFEPYHHLMRREANEYYKTGTLNGIRTRAGYIKHRNGRLYRFVVFINSWGKSCDPVMDQIHRLVSAQTRPGKKAG